MKQLAFIISFLTACLSANAQQLVLTRQQCRERALKHNEQISMDTIGTKGHFVNQADFVLNLVRRNGRWLVRMGGLPRSEKRNRDRS